MSAHHSQTFEVDYQGRTDGQPVYVGYADPGSAGKTNEALWLIMRIDYDGSDQVIQRVFAEGEAKFKFVWDDRLTYSYS